jgi:SNARE protein
MIEELQEIDEKLDSLEDEIQNGLNKLNNLKLDQKNKEIVRLFEVLDEAKKTLQNFDHELREIPKSQAAPFLKKKKSHAETLDLLKTNLEAAKKFADTEEFHIKEEQKTTEEKLNEATELQRDTMERISRGKKIIAETEQIGSNTLIQLQEDREKITQATNQMDTVAGNLSTAGKELR